MTWENKVHMTWENTAIRLATLTRQLHHDMARSLGGMRGAAGMLRYGNLPPGEQLQAAKLLEKAYEDVRQLSSTIERWFCDVPDEPSKCNMHEMLPTLQAAVSRQIGSSTNLEWTVSEDCPRHIYFDQTRLALALSEIWYHSNHESLCRTGGRSKTRFTWSRTTPQAMTQDGILGLDERDFLLLDMEFGGTMPRKLQDHEHSQSDGADWRQFDVKEPMAYATRLIAEGGGHFFTRFTERGELIARVLLPEYREQQSSPEGIEVEDQTSRSKILILHSQADALSIMEQRLTCVGFEVRVFEDEKSLLEFFKSPSARADAFIIQLKHDDMLTDVGMSKSLCEVIGHSPLLFIPAPDHDDDIEAAVLERFSTARNLGKVFTLNQLREALTEVLAENK